MGFAPITFTVSKEIPAAQVADLLVGAFEGGSEYWIQKLSVHKGKEKEIENVWEDAPSSANRFYSMPFTETGSILIKVLDEDGSEYGVRTLDRLALSRGLAILCEKYPQHYMNVIEGNDDAETSDVYLQCCVFGDVVFG